LCAQPTKAAAPQPPPTRPDPYYGHENTARLCGRFITHLFACPEYPPTSSGSNTKLPHFIAYALHRTKLHSSVTFASLALLQQLKARFPTARGSSGHRLFISGFMIASKVICDDTYSNKSWSIVGQGMFQLREINQMEREMCQYLDWELNIEPLTLKEFEAMVRKDFAGPGPYPTYVLQTISKLAASSTNPFPAIAQLEYESNPIIRPSSSISTKINAPSPINTHKPRKSIPHTPHHTRYTRTFVLRVDVSRFFGFAADTGGDDRRHCQDRLARVLPRHVDSGAGRTRFCRDEAEDVRIPSPFQVVAPHPFGILPHTPNSYRILASADYLFPASTGSRRTARLIAYFCKILGFCSGLLAHTYLLTLSTYQSG
jgi:Cyclin, N-terminal domain